MKSAGRLRLDMIWRAATWQEHAASLRVCHNYHIIPYTDVYVYDIYVSNSFFFLCQVLYHLAYMFATSNIGWDVMYGSTGLAAFTKDGRLASKSFTRDSTESIYLNE